MSRLAHVMKIYNPVDKRNMNSRSVWFDGGKMGKEVFRRRVKEAQIAST